MVMLAKPHPTPLQDLGQPIISIIAIDTHVLPSDLHDAMQVCMMQCKRWHNRWHTGGESKLSICKEVFFSGTTLVLQTAA